MQQSKTQRHNNKQTWMWRSITGELCNSIREQVQIRTKTVESSERHEKQDKSVDFGQVAGKFGADIYINPPPQEELFLQQIHQLRFNCSKLV